MKKPQTMKPATEPSPPPSSPGAESWLRLIDRVYGELTAIKAIIAANRKRRRKGGFARASRKPLTRAL